MMLQAMYVGMWFYYVQSHENFISTAMTGPFSDLYYRPTYFLVITHYFLKYISVICNTIFS